MRKPINPILYLILVSLLIFYGQKFLSTLGGSGPKNPSSRAEEAHMAEGAYYSLREVAGLQLGHVLITYREDEESGRLLARFRNEACPNLQADPEELRKGLENLQDELHRQVILIGPSADADGSGFVTEDEGARFRDLFAFGHLAAHYYGKGTTELAGLAQAAGLGAEEAALNLQEYRELVAGCPAEITKFFPGIRN
ncbi:MAG: hypothetical protein KOO60_01515 [Gemmatimonadales bacterium]|nr:hypothetical protein [Gemmatimonadales bacterium]